MVEERDCRRPTHAPPPAETLKSHLHLCCPCGASPSMAPQFIYFSKGGEGKKEDDPALLLAAFCVCARLFSRLDAGLTRWKKKSSSRCLSWLCEDSCFCRRAQSPCGISTTCESRFLSNWCPGRKICPPE